LVFTKIDNTLFGIMKNNIYPDPWDLRYFQEMAQTGNLSRASERLGVGQPALSLALKRLESGLGAKLFLRRNRGMVLTTAGRRLWREANGLLAAWDAVVSETAKSESELAGRFTLGCHPSVGIYALKDLLREIYQTYPGIEIQLVHGLSRVIAEGVISGTIDFGVAVNPIRHPDLVIQNLASDEVGFWRSPGGLEDVLIYNPSLNQSQMLLKRLKGRATFKRSIASENLELIATLAASGTGTAILPGRVVKAIAPVLKKVGGMPAYTDVITVIYRADIPKSVATQCLIRALRAVKI
jgi:LysR family transcriptional regulator, cell division regulator